MHWHFKEILKFVENGKINRLLLNSLHGLERECLRTNQKGEISLEPHPKALGSPLTNPYIVTDFSEAQLEFITPPLSSERAAIKFLEQVETFAQSKIPNEIFWGQSMPCILPKKEENIPLAQFGSSIVGTKKTTYRRGLGYRYGRRMQTISGIHYNFSFNKELFKELYRRFNGKGDLNDFISENYMRLIRNFMRFSWLVSYLFGATPAIDKTYLSKKDRYLKKHKKRTYYGQYATALRMSRLGYCCAVQTMLNIPFDSVDSYAEGLKEATKTPYPAYKKIGLEKKGEKLQLNDSILQIPNEYYGAARPKQTVDLSGDILANLQKNGIKYVELRVADIDPFTSSGVSLEQMEFLHVMAAYCLFLPSDHFKIGEKDSIISNHNIVALYGRKPGIKLKRKGKEVSLKNWGENILRNMYQVAEILDKAHKNKAYTNVIKKQLEKIFDPEKTPSAQIINALNENNQEFIEFGLELSQKNKTEYQKKNIPAELLERFTKYAQQSLKEQAAIEKVEKMLTEGFEDMELSTQLLIKEAKRRKIEVEILDRKGNFIRLKKGRKSELIKQATQTSKDSLISYFLMANKHISKIILKEAGLAVPQGEMYYKMQEALDDFRLFHNKKIVVKPVNTNFGIGITIFKARDEKQYRDAVKEAFNHDSQIIIEEFVTGREYRFLVIGKKVTSVLYRMPANVTGDGKSSIKELVKEKNMSKHPKYHLHLSKYEKDFLKKQNLTVNSIPQKDQTIYLRENSNVSTGGDPIDFTDEMPDIYKKNAIKAAQSASASFCGVDMIVKNLDQKANSTNCSIIEINFNPALYLHKYPWKGKGRDIQKDTLDFLGF